MKNISTLNKTMAGIIFMSFLMTGNMYAQFTTDLPYVELTTEQEPGADSVWYFWIEGKTDEDNGRIWVDWNNNGQYDEGEECPPSKSQTGQVVSQTIRVYGNITTFSCNEDHITDIDLSNNTIIERLYFTNNKVSSIDVSHLSNLFEFCCNGNRLSTVDVSGNDMLQVFNCSNNLLKEIDVSKNLMLTEFDCFENDIENINVQNNTGLQILYCNNTKITTLDISKNKELTVLNISDNKIDNIDISENALLEGLDCRRTLITGLDLSNNKKLTQLICNDLQLSTLDISNNPELYLVSCANCNLSSLDLSKHTKLEIVDVTYNNIESLDFSSATQSLIEIYCYANNISEYSMGNMIATLPDLNGGAYDGYLFAIDTENIKEKNVCNSDQVKAASDKYWTVFDFQNGANYGFNQYEGTKPSGVTAITDNQTRIWSCNSILYLNVPTRYIGMTMYVYDPAGKLVYDTRISSEEMDIEMNDLPEGTYIVTLDGKSCKINLQR